jgi:5-methylcytosine-specific restriction endonuclease McrA
MAKRYSEEWKKNVSNGLKRYRRKNPLTIEEKQKLKNMAIESNKNRIYKLKPINKLKPDQFRNRIIKERGRKCEKCGWNKKSISGIVPIQLHHINGIHEDNHRENVILLCPNCHSLVTETKTSYKKNGIKESTRKRYAYYKKKLS